MYECIFITITWSKLPVIHSPIWEIKFVNLSVLYVRTYVSFCLNISSMISKFGIPSENTWNLNVSATSKTISLKYHWSMDVSCSNTLKYAKGYFIHLCNCMGLKDGIVFEKSYICSKEHLLTLTPEGRHGKMNSFQNEIKNWHKIYFFQ